MPYVKTGLSGIGRIRLENGGGGSSAGPTPIYGTGFVVPSKEEGQLAPLIQPIRPPGPTFDVDDRAIVPQPPPPPYLPEAIRQDTVSEPTRQANAKLAFEYAEAEKWGYSHSDWMALGSRLRCAIRQKYPGGYSPITRDGTSVQAAQVETVTGRDPIRSKVIAVGAGDHPGGVEIVNPAPATPLRMTTAGITFDDIIQIDPVKAQTAEEAAGIKAGVGVNDYFKYAIYALSAWMLWDVFGKKQKPRRRRASKPMRRQYPYKSHAKHLRQGKQ